MKTWKQIRWMIWILYLPPKTLHKDLEVHAHWDLAHPMDYFSSPHTMNANFDLSFVTRLLLKITKRPTVDQVCINNFVKFTCSQWRKTFTAEIIQHISYWIMKNLKRLLQPIFYWFRWDYMIFYKLFIWRFTMQFTLKKLKWFKTERYRIILHHLIVCVSF